MSVGVVRRTHDILAAVIAHVSLFATDNDVMKTAARNPGWRIERDATCKLALGTAYVVLIDPYAGDIWSGGQAPEHFDVDFTRLL